MNTKSDIDLWKAIKQGDLEAFRYVYNKYYKDMYYYGLKLSNQESITKDCIHDLFFQIWSKKTALNQVHSIKPYLIKCFRRRLIKMMDSRRRLETSDFLLSYDTIQIRSAEEELILDESKTEIKNRLNIAINTLSRRQKEAIHLKYFMSLDYEEICEVMSLKYQTVRNLICESVKTIRFQMDKAVRMADKT